MAASNGSPLGNLVLPSRGHPPPPVILWRGGEAVWRSPLGLASLVRRFSAAAQSSSVRRPGHFGSEVIGTGLGFD